MFKYDWSLGNFETSTLVISIQFYILSFSTMEDILFVFV
jgi:hypothetical protein